MVKSGLTEIVCLIDNSSSMRPTAHEVRQGFAEFLRNQKVEPGDARVTLRLFDTSVKTLLDGASIADVPDGFLTETNYDPSGFTALFDALGSTVDLLGRRLHETLEQERPEKVIILVMTDGEENSSREYGASMLRDIVEHQRTKYSWEFVFIGANIDSFAAASNIGIQYSKSYQQSPGGTQDAFRRLSISTSRYRSTGKLDDDDVPVIIDPVKVGIKN